MGHEALRRAVSARTLVFLDANVLESLSRGALLLDREAVRELGA